MRAFFAAALFAPMAVSAAEMEYGRCIDLARIEPEATRVAAIRWYEDTGFAGALHCEAVALEEIGALSTAADRLTTAAQLPGVPDTTRVDLLVQAASLRRENGDLGAAISALDTALAFAETAAVHRERSIALLERRDFDEAVLSLNRALQLDPRDAQALTLRAAARRRLGELEGAKRDALDAIELRPVSAGAWFELGKVERELGFDGAARRAWLKTIDLAPSSPFATLARGGLQDMDGGE